MDLTERLRHPATRRTCVLAGAAVALGFVVWNSLAWRAAHQRTLELLDSTGLSQRQPDVARAAARDPDPTRARLAIARVFYERGRDNFAVGSNALHRSDDFNVIGLTLDFKVGRRSGITFGWNRSNYKSDAPGGTLSVPMFQLSLRLQGSGAAWW